MKVPNAGQDSKRPAANGPPIAVCVACSLLVFSLERTSADRVLWRKRHGEQIKTVLYCSLPHLGYWASISQKWT